MNDRIYLSPPHMGAAERELLLDAFDSNWIAPLGPHVDGFEKELSALHDGLSVAALSSGTAGLHLALQIAGVGRGDRVLVSDLTFAATVNAISYVGAEPVFVDCEPASWNADPELIREELDRSRRNDTLPKAAIIVDLYGQTADYDRIVPLLEEYGVALIEDAAEALGSTYKGQPAGTFGAMGVLSFNGNKIITTSGGGALLSRDAETITTARFLATQARDDAPHYQHSTIGYNYRLSNLLAAVGRGQLQVLSQRVEARRANFDRYAAAFDGVEGVTMAPEAPHCRSNRWLTCVTFEEEAFGASREDVRLALERENIEARPIWKPMHMQPVFSDYRVVGGAVGRSIFEKGLCLPSGSALTEKDVQRIAEIVRSVAPHSVPR